MKTRAFFVKASSALPLERRAFDSTLTIFGHPPSFRRKAALMANSESISLASERVRDRIAQIETRTSALAPRDMGSKMAAIRALLMPHAHGTRLSPSPEGPLPRLH
jgi:hypothetical protein